MKTAGPLAVEIAVKHQREPRERKPVPVVKSGKAPGDIFPRQSGLHVRVRADVDRVIQKDAAESASLGVNEERTRGQQERKDERPPVGKSARNGTLARRWLIELAMAIGTFRHGDLPEEKGTDFSRFWQADAFFAKPPELLSSPLFQTCGGVCQSASRPGALSSHPLLNPQQSHDLSGINALGPIGPNVFDLRAVANFPVFPAADAPMKRVEAIRRASMRFRGILNSVLVGLVMAASVG